VQEDNLVAYRNPGVALPVADPLTAVLRQGARDLLQKAIEAEAAAIIGQYQELKDEQGRQRVVRNGHLPERTIQTGIGAVAVKAPRVRDRAGELKFHSSILPPYLRRTRSLEELLPWLYLKGLSTSDFSSALTALLGKDAPGLSANTISRLKEVWKSEHEQWARRSLSGKEYVYLWADGIYFGVRLEDARQCMLVLIGATADGKKELLGIADGYRESEESWKELLLDLKRRGSLANALNSIPPEQLPLRNYVLCSEAVTGILNRRCNRWATESLGLLKLKGFSGWSEVFLVSLSAKPSVAS
jgi:putative transposase